jgi:NADH-quinone oxidoreductase subunit K
MIGLTEYLVVAIFLFCLGFYTILTRRNAVAVLMGVELILNAAALNFVAISRFVRPAPGASPLEGQIFTIFTIVLAATEAVVALAIILAIYQNLRSVNVDEASTLKE